MILILLFKKEMKMYCFNLKLMMLRTQKITQFLLVSDEAKNDGYMFSLLTTCHTTKIVLFFVAVIFFFKF